VRWLVGSQRGLRPNRSRIYLLATNRPHVANSEKEGGKEGGEKRERETTKHSETELVGTREKEVASDIEFLVFLNLACTPANLVPERGGGRKKERKGTSQAEEKEPALGNPSNA